MEWLYFIGSLGLVLFWARRPRYRLWIYHRSRRRGIDETHPFFFNKLQKYKDDETSGFSWLALVWMLCWPAYLATILFFTKLWLPDMPAHIEEDNTKGPYR
jgi:hypothetical protein